MPKSAKLISNLNFKSTQNMKTSFLISLTAFSLLTTLGCGTGGIGGGSGNDDIQYAALGASDVTGVGATPPTNGYVYLIKDGIENTGLSTNLLNYGIPSAEIGAIRDVELKLLDLGHKPDLVTLFTGSNDIIAGASASDFERDLDSILNHLRKIDGVKIFIANLPDITQFPRFKKDPSNKVTLARVQAFNQIISQKAALYNAQVIDLYSETSDDNLISSDGLHPNDSGYKRIADLFLQEILPAIH